MDVTSVVMSCVGCAMSRRLSPLVAAHPIRLSSPYGVSVCVVSVSVCVGRVTVCVSGSAVTSGMMLTSGEFTLHETNPDDNIDEIRIKKIR
jgi:hypothetical protein